MDRLTNPSEGSLEKKRFYSCFVPSCKNNSVRNPEKHFLTVPSDDSTRKKWFETVGKENNFIFKTVFYCCEDHFDLKNDAEKWINSTMSSGKKPILKKDVVPHVLQCPETSQEKPDPVIFKEEKLKILDSIDQAHPLDSSLKIEKESNVFSSKITRSARSLNNNLTDLLNTVPAQPVDIKKNDKIFICDFQPRTDKHFEPKKKTRFKVKTVGEIRHSFEKDVYSYLPAELEKQQNVLLRKIRAGSSRDENTKTLAKNMLKCDKPVSRSAWQMLMNLNPEECVHANQFVLLNGKRIRVNGSKGGKCKFLCKYDLGEKNVQMKIKSSLKRKSLIKKKGLLQNSLSINFKPGPLTKKTLLDDSYQKYHVGEIELLNLPMPGLEIQPTIGKAVDPTIANFLHNMQQVDGTISDKWAEFSVSVLSTIKNNNIVQCDDESCVTFDLSYKSDQRRILMRRDISSDFHKPVSNPLQPLTITTKDYDETCEVEKILDEMLHSVEISIEQENIYTGVDEPRIPKESNPNGTNVLVKDKPRRKYGELEKLDVTIIRLSENSEINAINTCPKPHCALGCLCASLECALNFKKHCGRPECMFECKCDFSKYKVINSFERDCSDLIPGLLNIDSVMSSKMAKEEQKFHQTVIVTSENSMLLKCKRRDWKSSRKYADFYSSMCLKTESKSDRLPAILLEKLNLDNVETWCMIHNLYKCFCKCIFTDNAVLDVVADETTANNSVQRNDLSSIEKPCENVEDKAVKTHSSASLHKDRIFSIRKNMKEMRDLFEKEPVEYFPDVIFDSECARVKPFTGRKHCNKHYLDANRKIMEMEKHDHTLRKRMLSHIIKSTNETFPQVDNDVEPGSDKTSETSTQPSSPLALEETTVPQMKMCTKRLPDKKNLVTWLETSYKLYKQRLDQGITKISLDPPKLGKMALFPWNFILSRYRDKKNLFLISKGPQYRIFMAVDTKHPTFNSCIDINDIRFADLHKYPATVKNLLTNATDLKDNFCILCGLSYCWELIGSVTKIGDQKDDKTEILLNNEAPKHDGQESTPIMYESEESNCESAPRGVVSDHVREQHAAEDETLINDSEILPESSKWFVMTVENDFDEIQFYNKGFFVKLQSIIKAINVARSSGKTVRLSSQKCADSPGPQFGIYAIPNQYESCVFVGPYEKNESLGIETVKNMLSVRMQRRTRGVWITTKKVDNFEVIDNPLSFLPSKNTPVAAMMTLTGDVINTDKNTECFAEINEVNAPIPQEKKKLKRHEDTKTLKPIKIRKTNGFFHLAPNGILKQISPQKYNIYSTVPGVIDKSPTLLNTTLLKQTESRSPLLSNVSSILNKSIPPPTLVTIHRRPIAEIAPHVKKPESSKGERGMSILKPEEINKRILQNLPTNPVCLNTADEEGIEMDIENFLATAEECVAPKDDILIISDEETDVEGVVVSCPIERWSKVWIECKTVEDLGWIPGRRNREGLLSFEFPGFKYTEFYEKQEACAKLNQVLSRKIYIPKNLNLEWDVVDSEQELFTKRMLKSEELDPDFVMTKRGIRRRQDIAIEKSMSKNHKFADCDDCDSKVESIKTESTFNIQKPKDSIESLEKTSQLLEDEGQRLWNKLTTNSGHTEALDDLREQIAARLQSMVSNT